jgi:hypothetical protein
MWCQLNSFIPVLRIAVSEKLSTGSPPAYLLSIVQAIDTVFDRASNLYSILSSPYASFPTQANSIIVDCGRPPLYTYLVKT